MHSPIGPLTISEEDGQIVSLDWGWGRDQHSTQVVRDAIHQLNQYFDGERAAFNIPFRVAGTLYRESIWRALARLSFGQTTTYGAIAREVGGAARSVGQACRHNPIPILIPCHRVLGSQGLGGFSGGEGLEVKRYLLEHEQRVETQS